MIGLRPSPPVEEPGPGGRSGSCYDDTHPRLHAICSGTFTSRDCPTASPERLRCGCPCHTPQGALLRGAPTGPTQQACGLGERAWR